MNYTEDIRKIIRVQLLVMALFIVNKFMLRPFVLEQMDIFWLKIFVLSFPNFCEAIIAIIVLTGLGLMANYRFLTSEKQFSNQRIYFLATIFAGLYVISQEFKIHNLGGRNVYDPYDVVFSIIGLVLGYLIIIIMKPQIRTL